MAHRPAGSSFVSTLVTTPALRAAPSNSGSARNEPRLQEDRRDVDVPGAAQHAWSTCSGPNAASAPGNVSMARSPSGRTKMTVNAVPTPGCADHAGHVDATVGQHLEHEVCGPIGADQPDEGGSQTEPGRGVRHERAAPAQRQRRARDFALRLAVREHLGRAAQDHVRVRVADDDEVVAGDHRSARGPTVVGRRNRSGEVQALLARLIEEQQLRDVDADTR